MLFLVNSQAANTNRIFYFPKISALPHFNIPRLKYILHL